MEFGLAFGDYVVGFWRLLVPLCCYFKLNDSSSIYALVLSVKFYFVARKDKTFGETSIKSASIYGCNSLLYLLIQKELFFPILVSR